MGEVSLSPVSTIGLDLQILYRVIPSDEHVFFLKAIVSITDKFGARLTAAHPDKKNLCAIPQLTSQGWQLLPRSSHLQRVGDDDVTVKQAITETHFMSQLTGFDV